MIDWCSGSLWCLLQIPCEEAIQGKKDGLERVLTVTVWKGEHINHGRAGLCRIASTWGNCLLPLQKVKKQSAKSRNAEQQVSTPIATAPCLPVPAKPKVQGSINSYQSGTKSSNTQANGVFHIQAIALFLSTPYCLLKARGLKTGCCCFEVLGQDGCLRSRASVASIPFGDFRRDSVPGLCPNFL